MSTKSPPKRTTAPRRTEILEVLRKHDKPLSERALFQAFAIRKGEKREAFVERIERMCRDGLLLCDRRGRYVLPERMDVIRGRVIGHARGFGHLAPDSGGSDLFIPPAEMRKVMHGDRIMARVAHVDRRGRQEVSVIEVLERANINVIGRFTIEQGLGFVAPNDVRIGRDIFIPPDQYYGARPGQIVVAEIKRQPSLRFQPIGKVVEVVGEHMSPGMEIEIAIRKFGLPNSWSDVIDTEVHALDPKWSKAELARRWDLTQVPLVTIDGEDARDFDDAVFAERTDKGWRLIVAIADVSYYVPPGAAIDVEAVRRGNSVYFPDYVIPMLPERLSNDLCSLRPEVERLCFACEMFINRSGELTDYRFKPAVMRSTARLTYNEVAQALQHVETDRQSLSAEIGRNLVTLHELSRSLRSRRQRQGTVDFELPETRIIFDDERKIRHIEPVARNDAHILIEECMLAANICAARTLIEHWALALFRVHENPNKEKVADVRGFIGEFGLSLAGGDDPSAKNYADVVDASRGKPFTRIVQMALLRSMKQAVYSKHNDGHFALGFKNYAHFTSPIRRYPDLVVHRELKKIVAEQVVDYDEVDHHNMSELAEHCCMTERRADEATREVVQWLKAEFMQDHVGEEFDGTVSSVTDFGIFIELDDYYIEGLAHITTLGRDYFHFDPVARRLHGERSGRTYEIGAALKVRVVRVDLDEAKIDLEPVGTTGGDRKGRRQNPRKGKNGKRKKKDANAKHSKKEKARKDRKARRNKS